VIRLVMPKTGTTEVVDLIRGSVSFKNDLQEDFVALKSDGYPTYHLASVIDDHTMEISHVIRGEEWLSSVPKHIALYKAFGWDMPQFAHLSLLLNPDKTKLSKRQGDVAVADYQKKGYLPEALVNFVAFLGWNPGDEREIFSLDGLASAFSLEKVSKAGAVFNVEKLDWYNKEYIKAMSPGAFAEACLPWLLEARVVTQDSFANKEYRAWLEKALSLEKERVTTLAEIVPALGFVFKQPEFAKELLVWRKGTPEEVAKILPEVRAVIAGVSDWTKAGVEQAVAKFIADKGYTVGSVLWPLRVSLSGQQNSPGPYEIAEVLGQEESLRRLDAALAK
jgi:glutamyl-tRNA synthetase